MYIAENVRHTLEIIKLSELATKKAILEFIVEEDSKIRPIASLLHV